MPSPFQLMKMKPVARGEPYEPFSRISIETISWCNRRCGFCPVAWTDRGRRSMSDELFASICRQLGEMEFDGVIQTFLLSEPLIDPKIHERIADLRAACPRATIYASTNGDALDAHLKRGDRDGALRRLRRLYDAGLTVLGLNVYDEGPDQAVRYKAFFDAAVSSGAARTSDRSKYARHPVGGRWLYLTDMRQSSQDGSAAAGEDASELGFSMTTDRIYDKVKEGAAAREPAPQLHCHRTQRHLVVEWDGRVPLCCAIDVTDPSVGSAGNASASPLLGIWNSDFFRKYRWHTQRGERVLPGCSTCHHRMGGFPHAVRRVADPSARELAAWEAEVRREAGRLGRG